MTKWLIKKLHNILLKCFCEVLFFDKRAQRALMRVYRHCAAKRFNWMKTQNENDYFLSVCCRQICTSWCYVGSNWSYLCISHRIIYSVAAGTSAIIQLFCYVLFACGGRLKRLYVLFAAVTPPLPLTMSSVPVYM